MMAHPLLCGADRMHLAPWVIVKGGRGWSEGDPARQINLLLPNSVLGLSGKPGGFDQQENVEVILFDRTGPYPADARSLIARRPQNLATGWWKRTPDSDQPGLQAYRSGHRRILIPPDETAYFECPDGGPRAGLPNSSCLGWIFAGPGVMTARVSFSSVSQARLADILRAAEAVDRRVTTNCRRS